MRKMTERNLRDAFAGESQAHMRYLILLKKPNRKVYLMLLDCLGQ